MKSSILVVLAAVQVLALASILLDSDESTLQAIYARHGILPRGVGSCFGGQCSGGPPSLHQGLTAQSSSSSHSSPRAPSSPDSPRTAGTKADAAEAKAREARTNFQQTGASQLKRLQELDAQPTPKDPEMAYRNQMSRLNDYRAVPRAKDAQAQANKEAAEAAGKAGRFDRQDRYNRKAAASAVQGQFHHADLDVQEHATTGINEHRKYQQASLHGAPIPVVSEARTKVLASDRREDEAKRQRDGLIKEARRLRNHEGGRDTDSSASDTSG